MHYQQPFRQMLYKGFPKVVITLHVTELISIVGKAGTIKIFVPDKCTLIVKVPDKGIDPCIRHLRHQHMLMMLDACTPCKATHI